MRWGNFPHQSFRAALTAAVTTGVGGGSQGARDSDYAFSVSSFLSEDSSQAQTLASSKGSQPMSQLHGDTVCHERTELTEPAVSFFVTGVF